MTKSIPLNVQEPRIFCILLNQLEPTKCSLPDKGADHLTIAQCAVDNAHKLGVVTFVQPTDLCNNLKLTTLFAAQIFHVKTGLGARRGPVKVRAPVVHLAAGSGVRVDVRKPSGEVHLGVEGVVPKVNPPSFGFGMFDIFSTPDPAVHVDIPAIKLEHVDVPDIKLKHADIPTETFDIDIEKGLKMDQPEVHIPSADIPPVHATVAFDMFGLFSARPPTVPSESIDINPELNAHIPTENIPPVNETAGLDMLGFFSVRPPSVHVNNMDVSPELEIPRAELSESSFTLDVFGMFSKPSVSIKVDENLEIPKVVVPTVTEDVRLKAQSISFFHVDEPRNVVDGIVSTEYNLLKAGIAAPVLFITAPFVGATDEALKYDDVLAKTQGVFVGFGRGFVRGVSGGAALVMTGVISGGHQLYKGVCEAADRPGEGRGVMASCQHILNSNYCDLVLNIESDSFQTDLDALIAADKLKAFELDAEGKEVPVDHSYQFFITDTPGNFVDGFGQLQYNATKGVLAGSTLLLCAPLKDAYTRYNSEEKDGRRGGIEGGLKGFGQGMARGIIGGVLLTSSGVAYGLGQFGKGIVQLRNVTDAADAVARMDRDFRRLTHDPVTGLVLQKGYGLEEYLAEQQQLHDESIGAEKAKKTRTESIRRNSVAAKADPKASADVGGSEAVKTVHTVSFDAGFHEEKVDTDTRRKENIGTDTRRRIEHNDEELDVDDGDVDGTVTGHGSPSSRSRDGSLYSAPGSEYDEPLLYEDVDEVPRRR